MSTGVKMPEWAKIVLKAIVYIAGLLLAGVGTTAGAQMLGVI